MLGQNIYKCYDRFQIQSNHPKCQARVLVVILGIFWYFGKLVAEERWLVMTGGHNHKFDCGL